jgi:hypothetical protein
MDDLVTDHGFIVENSSSVEKARLGYNQTNSTALLELKNGSGTYFEANDELIDSKDGYYMNADRVLRPDGASAWVGEDFSRLRFNPTGRVYLDKTMWVSSSQPISSSAQPSNVFIKFTNELTLSTLGKTSATTNDAMLFKSGVPVVDAVGLTETLFHFQNDGNDLLDIKANGVVKYKEFTVATLPLVTSGGFIMVTDETGGYTPAFCDGTNWRRTSDNAIVS